MQDSFRTEFDPIRPKINLKGLAIGNGFIDPVNQVNYGDYFYQLGLVDSNGQEILKQYKEKIIDSIKIGDFETAAGLYDQLINGVITPTTVFQNLTGFANNLNYLRSEAEYFSTFDEFMKTPEIRRAIHVGNNTFTDLFDGSALKAFNFLILDIMQTVAPWLSELLSYYPIFMYNGQLDCLCPYPLTDNILKHLNFSGAGEFKTANRTIWHVGSKIAGYAKKAGNLTQILVRNAGRINLFYELNPYLI